MNIVLIGFMGTGKTVVGRRLARRLGWRFVDIDRLIESGAGLSVAAIFARRGEAVFRRLERQHIHRVMRGDRQVVATGGGAFADPVNRRRLQGGSTVVCLTAKPRAILDRVGRRIRTRPLLNGGDNPLVRIRRLLAQRAKAYGQADVTIDTSNLSVETAAERVWEHLSPSLSQSWQYLLDHASELSKRYAGRYIAVIGSRLVASGETQLEAFQRIPRRQAGHEEAGVYYIPLPQESLTIF